jgi:hypothetical protein
MDRELDLDELLQPGLSRRDLLRSAGVAGISLSALLDLAWQPATSAAQASSTRRSGSVSALLALSFARKNRPTTLAASTESSGPPTT